jgi:hypothetical protein
MIKTIKTFVPDLISLAKIEDSEIEEALIRYKNRILSYKKTEEIIIEPHCLFDLILSAKNSDAKSFYFLKFINDQARELFEKVDSTFHKEIRSTLKKIVFSFDTDVTLHNNPSYLNFLGEIAGLNHILNNVKNRFDLKEIEKKLPNGKSVDFVFYDNDSNEFLYVDFVSIHSINVKKLSCFQDLITFLELKFDDKLSQKTINLNGSFKIKIDDLEINFTILPIIWTEISDLLPFQEAFKVIDEKYANVFSCFSLLPLESIDKSLEYCFTTVSNIIEIWNKENASQ